MAALRLSGRPPRLSTAIRTAGSLQSLALATSRLLTRAWLPPGATAGLRSTAGRIAEVRDFGSNPGDLRMLVFEPPRAPPVGAPLIVVLHGCRQDAETFAMHSGWLDIARVLGIPLVMPEQVATNNRHRCFNWFRPGDAHRGRGEAMSIRQMVRTAARRFGSDRRRIFIVGLSAGGAMSAAMLAAYPAVFAGGAVVAGMPVGTADSAAMALLRMHRADWYRTRTNLVAAVRARTSSRGTRPWPRLSIWQGGSDRTVDPANADVLAAQWSGLHGLGEDPAADSAPVPGTRRRTWGRTASPAVELWTIPDLTHGFPIDAKGAEFGSSGPWVVDAGISAALHIAAFWGIRPSGL